MNTNRLAKFYSGLTALERLRLLHDAGRRGDTVEARRLTDSAPRRQFSIADSGQLENQLRIISATHHAFQLGTASEFWHAQFQWSSSRVEVSENEPVSDDGRFWLYSATIYEAIYAINRDGWNLFVQGTGVDESRIRVPQLAGHWMIQHMDQNAFVDPESQTVLKWLITQENSERVSAESTEPLKLISPEDVADDWNLLVEEITAS